MSSGKLLILLVGIVLFWGLATSVTACRGMTQDLLSNAVRLNHIAQISQTLPDPAIVAVPQYHESMAEDGRPWGGMGLLGIGALLALGFMLSAMTGHKGINGLLDSARKYRGVKPRPAAPPRPSGGQPPLALPPDHPDSWAYNPLQLQARPDPTYSPPAADSWLVPRSGSGSDS